MKRIVSVAMLAVLPAVSAGSGDPTAGEQKAATCVACHGKEGGAPISPQYPILAGQYAGYLAHALHQYKDGGRKNAIMSGLAAALSDEDIEDLAAYFASRKSALRTID